MKNWTYQIIEELREHHSEVPSDLTRFAKQTLLIQATDLAAITNFVRVLNELEIEGYITWKACNVSLDSNGKEIYGEWDEWEWRFSENSYIKKNIGKTIDGLDRTLDNNRIEGRLTIKGIDYAFKIKREDELFESALDTNKSFKSANWWMPRLTMGLIVASLSPIFIELIKDKQSQNILQPLQEKVKTLNNSQEIQKMRIDSLLRETKKSFYRLDSALKAKN